MAESLGVILFHDRCLVPTVEASSNETRWLSNEIDYGCYK